MGRQGYWFGPYPFVGVIPVVHALRGLQTAPSRPFGKFLEHPRRQNPNTGRGPNVATPGGKGTQFNPCIPNPGEKMFRGKIIENSFGLESVGLILW